MSTITRPHNQAVSALKENGSTQQLSLRNERQATYTDSASSANPVDAPHKQVMGRGRQEKAEGAPNGSLPFCPQPTEGSMSELTQLNLFNGKQTATRSYESSIIEVSRNVLPVLWQESKKLHRNKLRTWMKRAFGGSDTDGIWDWKDVYEAQECAVVMLLAHKAKAIAQHSELDSLHDLAKMGDRLLTHTQPREESVELQ